VTAPGVAEALQPYLVCAFEAELKCVGEATPVYIVGARPAHPVSRCCAAAAGPARSPAIHDRGPTVDLQLVHGLGRSHPFDSTSTLRFINKRSSLSILAALAERRRLTEDL
jgi:hypothetical protein